VKAEIDIAEILSGWRCPFSIRFGARRKRGRRPRSRKRGRVRSRQL